VWGNRHRADGLKGDVNGVLTDIARIEASFPRGAYITPDGVYRYFLTRGDWRSGQGRVCWVMLNPSTADANIDDATVRRCIGYTRDWGYAELVVVNLFALRATNPAVLRLHDDPKGPSNDGWIVAAANSSDLVVCAWGSNGPLAGRDGYVVSLLEPYTALHAVSLNGRTSPNMRRGFQVKLAVPAHPLYLSAALKPMLFVEKRRPIGVP